MAAQAEIVEKKPIDTMKIIMILGAVAVAGYLVYRFRGSIIPAVTKK